MSHWWLLACLPTYLWLPFLLPAPSVAVVAFAMLRGMR